MWMHRKKNILNSPSIIKFQHQIIFLYKFAFNILFNSTLSYVEFYKNLRSFQELGLPVHSSGAGQQA